MRSDLFDHIMVWIYNSEISCQMDIRMNILLTYSTPVVRGRPIYLLKANRYRYIGIGIPDIGIGYEK